MARTRLLGWLILILLLYFGLRLHDLMTLPLFIDETLHADRAVSVWHGSPLWFGVNGKLLSNWWIALFYPFPTSPWLMRAAILLMTVVGAAAAVSLARRLYGDWAALAAGLLLVGAPMLFFFDRMALADTILHPTLTLFVLSLFYALERPVLQRRWVIFCGAGLALAITAKASALAIIPLPFVAVWLLPRGWKLAERLKALAWLFGTTLLLWLPLLVAMRSRNINYLGVPISEHSATGSNLLLVERLIANLTFLLEGLVVYFGAIPLLIAAAAMIAAAIAQPRRGLVLALAVIGPAIGFILIGDTGVSMRYWLGLLPLALALAACGLWVIARWLVGPRIGPALLLALLSVWGISAALPFIQTAYADPAALTLPRKDRLEYLEADSAGTMLPELAAFLADEAARLDEPLAVTGAISQCDALALYLPHGDNIFLDCPRVFSPEGSGPALDAHVAALAAQHPHYYVVFERPGLVLVDAITSTPLDTIAAFPRPGDMVTISVYRPTPP